MMDADSYTDALATAPDADDDTGEPLTRYEGDEQTEGDVEAMLANLNAASDSDTADGDADADTDAADK